MATETTANVDEKMEKKLNEEVGEGEKEVAKKSEPAIAAPASDAPVANKLEEEKDLSDSQTVSVTETAPDPVLSQPAEKPAGHSTLKETPADLEKESIKNEEPEGSEANPLTQVDSEKEAENSGLESIEEDKPEPVAKDEKEKPTEIETKEIIDKVDEEQVKTVDISTLADQTECTDKYTEPVDLKDDSSPREESSEDTENSEIGSTDRVGEVKEEPIEPEKESTEKGEEQREKVNIEESSAAPPDEPSDSVESNSPKESNGQEVLETEPKEDEKLQPEVIEVEEKRSVLEILTEKLGGEHQDTKDFLAAEDAKNEVEERKPSKEDGTSVTECVELAPTEHEAHTTVVESSPSEADKFEVAELKKEVNEPSEVEKVEVALRKEELNEPSALEVLSREVAEQVSNTQEAQADTREEAKDSSLSIAAEEVSIDVENKEANAVEAEEATEEESVKIKNEIPVAGDEDVHEGSKSEEVTEAVKDKQPPVSKPDLEEEPTVKTEGRDLEKDQTEDIVKTDVQKREETTKESDYTTQTSENHEEVPAKQKQSNIFSKVKQSLAKAKKAITGKSPNPKTILSDTKGDITAK